MTSNSFTGGYIATGVTAAGFAAVFAVALLGAGVDRRLEKSGAGSAWGVC